MIHRKVASKKDAKYTTCRPRRSAKPTSYGICAAGLLLYKPAGVPPPLALRVQLGRFRTVAKILWFLKSALEQGPKSEVQGGVAEP